MCIMRPVIVIPFFNHAVCQHKKPSAKTLLLFNVNPEEAVRHCQMQQQRRQIHSVPETGPSAFSVCPPPAGKIRQKIIHALDHRPRQRKYPQGKQDLSRHKDIFVHIKKADRQATDTDIRHNPCHHTCEHMKYCFTLRQSVPPRSVLLPASGDPSSGSRPRLPPAPLPG